jgi:hypothetical protein
LRREKAKVRIKSGEGRMEDSGYDLEEGYLSLTTDHGPPMTNPSRFTIYDLLFAWDSGTNDACFTITDADTIIYKPVSCPTCLGQNGTRIEENGEL